MEEEGCGASEPLDEVRKGMRVVLTVRCVSVGRGPHCPNLGDDIPHCQNQTIQFVLPFSFCIYKLLNF